MLNCISEYFVFVTCPPQITWATSSYLPVVMSWVHQLQMSCDHTKISTGWMDSEECIPCHVLFLESLAFRFSLLSQGLTVHRQLFHQSLPSRVTGDILPHTPLPTQGLRMTIVLNKWVQPTIHYQFGLFETKGLWFQMKEVQSAVKYCGTV